MGGGSAIVKTIGMVNPFGPRGVGGAILDTHGGAKARGTWRIALGDGLLLRLGDAAG